MKDGLFITFEGTDGVGKTTQIKKLKRFLSSKGHRVVLTREPGGGPLAEKIRRLLLDPNIKMENQTELLLYQAARVEHVEKVIRPALKKRKIVLCDRFTDATLAYQGYARRLPLAQIEELNHMATAGLKPHLTLLLNLPPRVGLKKAQNRNGAKKKGDRLEKEGLSFQKKVQKGYLSLARKYPRRIKIIPVKSKIDDTQQLIRKAILKRLPS